MRVSERVEEKRRAAGKQIKEKELDIENGSVIMTIHIV